MSDDFVELIGNMGAGLGLSKAACQLYALLFITGRALSLDAMSEQLGISKGNVSVNIRALERWGAAKKIWRKGSRKDYYRAEEDIEKIVMERLSDGLGKRIDDIREYIAENKNSKDIKQLDKLEVFAAKAGKIVKLVGDENIRGMIG